MAPPGGKRIFRTSVADLPDLADLADHASSPTSTVRSLCRLTDRVYGRWRILLERWWMLQTPASRTMLVGLGRQHPCTNLTVIRFGIEVAV
jgi:hypothetical protein